MKIYRFILLSFICILGSGIELYSQNEISLGGGICLPLPGRKGGDFNAYTPLIRGSYELQYRKLITDNISMSHALKYSKIAFFRKYIETNSSSTFDQFYSSKSALSSLNYFASLNYQFKNHLILSGGLFAGRVIGISENGKSISFYGTIPASLLPKYSMFNFGAHLDCEFQLGPRYAMVFQYAQSLNRFYEENGSLEKFRMSSLSVSMNVKIVK